MLEPNETHSADNELLAQMLQVMERLAAYAYFWDVSEIEFDFSSLVRILDPRTDNYPNSKLYWRNEFNVAKIVNWSLRCTSMYKFSSFSFKDLVQYNNMYLPYPLVHIKCYLCNNLTTILITIIVDNQRYKKDNNEHIFKVKRM